MTESLLPHTTSYGATKEDLDWWLLKAETLEWIFAKTYADTAPHYYVVHPRTKDMTREEYARVCRVIRTFGQPGKFYSSMQIYLTDPASGWKYWSMDPTPEMTDLINRAPIADVYGEQNAPITYSGAADAGHVAAQLYDHLSSEYDQLWQSPSDLEENKQVARVVARLFPGHAPTVLDVGCGTGLNLDLHITHQALYVGIDPSQGMLNELVRKHWHVRRLMAMTAEEAFFTEDPVIRSQVKGPFDLVMSTFSSASYLEPRTLEAMRKRAGGYLFLMTYEEGYLPDYYAETGLPEPATNGPSRQKAREMTELYDGEHFKIGAFDCWVIPGGFY